MRIFLNPGHDVNLDSGAVNPHTGLRECDVALQIGMSLQSCLKECGHFVEMLQSDNLAGETPHLPCVVDAAEEAEADIFISIHCNAANGIARGTETLVHHLGGEADVLARFIQREIVSALGTRDRGVKERPELIVLRLTSMPAVLVETAFIDQDDDAFLLENHADTFAAAIEHGIAAYEAR